VVDLKTFSRSDDVAAGPVELEKVLDLSTHLAWNEIRHRAKLVKDYAGLPPVLGTESKLGQVFLNLIVNAAQAIPMGQAERNQIRIRGGKSGDQVWIEVSDTGSGIPPELRERVFEPFFTTKPVGEGTGLGLSIVHNIVKGFGGEVALESTMGQGTTFKVTLPAAKEPSGDDEKTPVQRKLVGAQVLVVDDEVQVATSVRRTLRRHQVAIANSGKDALERLEAGQRFDIIFCDLMMPEMTGMELYELVKARYRDQAERVVFLTGGAFTSAAKNFLDTVTVPHVEKPFDGRQLEAHIERLIAKNSAK